MPEPPSSGATTVSVTVEPAATEDGDTVIERIAGAVRSPPAAMVAAGEGLGEGICEAVGVAVGAPTVMVGALVLCAKVGTAVRGSVAGAMVGEGVGVLGAGLTATEEEAAAAARRASSASTAAATAEGSGVEPLDEAARVPQATTRTAADSANAQATNWRVNPARMPRRRSSFLESLDLPTATGSCRSAVARGRCASPSGPIVSGCAWQG